MAAKEKGRKQVPSFRDRQRFPESSSPFKQLRLLLEGSMPLVRSRLGRVLYRVRSLRALLAGAAIRRHRLGLPRAVQATMFLAGSLAIAAFAVQLNPTLPEMADIKTAVSEAVTNAIVHGYRGREDGLVRMSAEYGDRRLLTVVIRDEGCGIADVEKAMQPFYSTGDGAERSGMGFCVRQTFMDAVEVDSAVDRGTTVTMRKYITGEVGLHRERMLDEIG